MEAGDQLGRKNCRLQQMEHPELRSPPSLQWQEPAGEDGEKTHQTSTDSNSGANFLQTVSLLNSLAAIKSLLPFN